MKRWLVLTLGLGVAAIAGVVLLTSGDIGSNRKTQPPATLAPPLHDDIDKESREKLREILREADDSEAGSP